MSTKHTQWIVGVLVAAAWILGIIVYPHLPPLIASHWSASGVVNGYMPRGVGILMLPVVMLVIGIVYLIIPWLDPLKRNIEAFRPYYNGLFAAILVFLLYIDIFMVLWNLGYQVPVASAMSFGLGILFFYIGMILPHLRQSWFVGIRTPWTLSSKDVWERTHRIGGSLFKAIGILALLGVVFPKAAFGLVIGSVMAVVIFLVVYSFVKYRTATDKLM